jgi:hypothetical protein
MITWEQKMPRFLKPPAVHCDVCAGENESRQSTCKHCQAPLAGPARLGAAVAEPTFGKERKMTIGLIDRCFPGNHLPIFNVRAIWPWIIGFLWATLILWSFSFL